MPGHCLHSLLSLLPAVFLPVPKYTMQDPGPATLPVASVHTGISGIQVMGQAFHFSCSGQTSILLSVRVPTSSPDPQYDPTGKRESAHHLPLSLTFAVRHS